MEERRRFEALLQVSVILAGDRTIFVSLVAARPCPWLFLLGRDLPPSRVLADSVRSQHNSTTTTSYESKLRMCHRMGPTNRNDRRLVIENFHL